MKIIYNVVNMYIGNIIINIHDNVCNGSHDRPGQHSPNNFTAFAWNSNEPLITELQQRIEQSEREKQELTERLNQDSGQAANHHPDN